MTAARALVVTTGVLLCAAPSARSEDFATSATMLIEHVPLGDFPSNPSSGNDCWGYVSPSGREYALMGLRDAVAVVEITDPDGMEIVGSIPHQESNWCDIKVYGDVAYASNESGGGVDVIDLSQVDAGVVTLVQRVTDAGLQTVHNLAVDEDSGFLYLCASNIAEGRLVAMDLSDPSDPVIAGMVPVAEGGVPHDAHVITYDSGLYAGRQVAFSSSGTDGLEIYDVTDKSDMVLLAQSTYPNHTFTHQAWLSEDYAYLYLNDELDSVNETVIFDVTDIEAPLVVGSYDSGVDATDHNLYTHENRIYEAEYHAGMRIFDATDPVAPVQIGWIDTFPGDDAGGSGGAWSVFPYFPSGKVIVSDKDRGLFLVWPDEPPLVITPGAGAVPEQISPDGGETFLVQIDEAGGQALEPDSPTLVYDFGDSPVEAPMQALGGGLYEAQFGAMPCGSFVQFHLRAATTSGVAVREPQSAPCDTFVAVAAATAEFVLEDDLETASGWTVGPDSAVTGQWTLVDPIGTDAQPDTDHTPEPGTQCFVTGQGAVNGNVGDADVDGGFTLLTSPLLDLAGFEQATIAYWRWFHDSFSQIDGDEGGAPNEDVMRVFISNDDGATYLPVETVGPAGPETAGGWFLHAFDPATILPLTSQMRLRFVVSDQGAPSIVEAAVDDVVVVSVGCEAVWTDLGGGKAGAAGTPILAGTGPMTDGSANAVELTGAAASTTTTLVVGFAQIAAPFKGGTLVPSPDVLVGGLPTDAQGASTLPFTWPSGVPAGLPLYWQHWIVDETASNDLAASNGLQSLSQ